MNWAPDISLQPYAVNVPKGRLDQLGHSNAVSPCCDQYLVGICWDNKLPGFRLRVLSVLSGTDMA